MNKKLRKKLQPPSKMKDRIGRCYELSAHAILLHEHDGRDQAAVSAEQLRAVASGARMMSDYDWSIKQDERTRVLHEVAAEIEKRRQEWEHIDSGEQALRMLGEEIQRWIDATGAPR